MFSKKNLQNIATIFLIFIALSSTLTNKSLAQNSSAYNGIRITSADHPNDCNEDTTEEEEGKEKGNPPPYCYTSDAYEDEEDPRYGMCKKGEFNFDPYGDNADSNWSFSNDSCLGFIYGPGVALQLAFYSCDFLCPAAAGSSSEVEAVAKEPKEAFAELIKTNAQRGLEAGAEYGKTAAIQAGSAAGTVSLATLSGMPIDPFVLIKLGRYTYNCGLSLAGNPLFAGCCTALGVCGGATAIAIAALSSIWDIARDNFYNTAICGTGWTGWKRETLDKTTMNRWKILDGNYAICLKKIFGETSYCTPGLATDTPTGCRKTIPQFGCDSGSIKNKSQERYCDFVNIDEYRDENECLEANVKGNNGTINETPKKYEQSMTNIHYREFLYKGIEYVDNGTGACKNPIHQDANKKNKWTKDLGYPPDEKDGAQRYYFKGPNQTPNFACERFLSSDPKDLKALESFTCCKKNSQKTICLEKFIGRKRGNAYQFCRKGEECSTNFNVYETLPFPIKYKIFESEVSKNYICAKTYTVCPYDHHLQGGTDKAQLFYYNPKILSNFCQYMSHCIPIAPISENNYFDPKTFFFAESCKDLRGDSQFFLDNEVGRVSRISSLYSRNFSAPMVQCFKETLENQFMQKMGRTICEDKNEIPIKTKANPDGECVKSKSVQKKGEVINQTFFTKVQKRFLIPIKIALVLSVVMFGFNILLATPEAYINKKTVMTYLVKFGLVYFFVIGNAWQGFFMDSVMNVSSEFADITFSPKSTKDKSSPEGDGCDFPKYNYSSLLEPALSPGANEATRTSEMNIIKINPSYPPGKNYLRIWDTLDCKIARAIGYGPEVTTPHLAKMIFAGFLSGGLGIMFFFAAFAYGVMLFSIAMRAIHITIMSIMGVILLIYVSPLTITCALFERTKGIFENWWKQMLGFILQPMILFAYLGLMLTVFDDLFIADARFIPVDGKLPKIDCTENLEIRSNPDENSIYCILKLNKYENYTGLELFDLAIPVLQGLNKEKINTLTKAAIIMFVFLKFLDKITTVAKKLVGGVELKADSTSDIQNQLKKVAKGIQKRALNTTKKLATKTIPNFAKKKIRSDSKSMPKIDNNTNNGDSAGSSS